MNYPLIFEDAAFGKAVELEVQELKPAIHAMEAEQNRNHLRKNVFVQWKRPGEQDPEHAIWAIKTPQHAVHAAEPGAIIDSPCSTAWFWQCPEKAKNRVKIPPGVDTGSRLRVTGEGEAGEKGGPTGDLMWK